ncbi:hypothetical protein ACFL0M_07945 [Thermodesulfobacteriota bacterium]
MRDWIAKLEDFIRISDRDIPTHAGLISHDEAIEKVRAEYAKFSKQLLEVPSLVERHFIEAIKEVKKIEKKKKPRNRETTKHTKYTKI